MCLDQRRTKRGGAMGNQPPWIFRPQQVLSPPTPTGVYATYYDQPILNKRVVTNHKCYITPPLPLKTEYVFCRVFDDS